MRQLKKQIMKLLQKSNSPRLSQTKPLFINMNDIGLVGFKRSYKAKRLILKIKEDSSVFVSVPRGVSFEIAMSFAMSKAQWINDTIKKMSLHKQKRESSSIKINLIDRDHAKRIIKNRVEDIAEKHGFFYNRIAIKDQKTIWGSCSSKNNLNFNYKIASLPEQLMDYIILHELVHTKIKNHSKLFWNTLDQYVQNSKSLRKELINIQFSG